MVRYGNIIRCESQLCLVHAIHLAVKKVFYKKDVITTTDSQTNDYNESLSDEEEEEEDNENEERLFNCAEDVSLVVEDSYNNILRKARKIVQYFKRSPVKNGVLQKHIKSIPGINRELKLKTDCPIRWNSILTMVNRLVDVEQAIENAFEELGEDHYEKSLFDALKEITFCLKPFKEAILEIGKSDSNLLKADTAIQYVLNCLSKLNSNLAEDLAESLKSEVQKRRKIALVSLYKCLQSKSLDFINSSSNEFGYSSKSEIIDTARVLYYQLFDQPNSNQDVLDDELGQYFNPSKSSFDETENSPENLAELIQKEMAESSQKSTQSDMKDEFKSMIISKVLTPKLTLLYHALSTIQPSSTSCEETFSVAALFATKKRNQVGPTLLNALVFLKYFFFEKRQKTTKESQTVIGFYQGFYFHSLFFKKICKCLDTSNRSKVYFFTL